MNQRLAPHADAPGFAPAVESDGARATARWPLAALVSTSPARTSALDDAWSRSFCRACVIRGSGRGAGPRSDRGRPRYEEASAGLTDASQGPALHPLAFPRRPLRLLRLPSRTGPGDLLRHPDGARHGRARPRQRDRQHRQNRALTRHRIAVKAVTPAVFAARSPRGSSPRTRSTRTLRTFDCFHPRRRVATAHGLANTTTFPLPGHQLVTGAISNAGHIDPRRTK